jgi:hypothetical protein
MFAGAVKLCGFRSEIWISVLPKKTFRLSCSGSDDVRPVGISETEILLAYGGALFASKIGR